MKSATITAIHNGMREYRYICLADYSRVLILTKGKHKAATLITALTESGAITQSYIDGFYLEGEDDFIPYESIAPSILDEIEKLITDITRSCLQNKNY